MKHYINFLILIVLFQVNEATSQSIYFERTYDTLGFYYANCIKQLPEGGYIFCGSNYSISNAQDAAIAKIDSSGNVVWAKVFGGQNTDGAISIELCNDSTYFVFGIRDNISPQQSDIWVLKLDQNGDTLYTKSILLGAGANVVRGSVATNDGGYALIGNTDTRGYGMNDFSLIKLNTIGDTSWIKTFGSTQSELGWAIQQTNDSGYILVGETSGFNASVVDIYIVKTDINGDTLWTWVSGIPNADFAKSVKQTGDGGFIVAGMCYDTVGGNYETLLLKFDSEGDLIWEKRLHNLNENTANSLMVLPDGGFVIGGTIESNSNFYNMYLVRTDSLGDTLWTKDFGGTSNYELGYSIALTADGGYIIAGSSDMNMTNAAYIVKVDSAGNLSTGIRKVNSQSDFIVFPNPATSLLNIVNNSGKFQKDLEYFVYNIQGVEVLKGKLEENFSQSVLDLASCSSGIYFIQIAINTIQIQSFKICLTH
ncbi:MAG: T9SS type A sorting domain-containing protein [Bacteroidia bacterium]|nr:T9SS type A sorting domain-containing protein [Bacteroidia bacterium]